MSALRSALGDLGAAVPETDAHDDEFLRSHRRDIDLDVQPPERDLVRRVQSLVDAHLVGVLALEPHEPSVFPDAIEEAPDRALERLPQPEVVGLEDRPTDALLD